jgi:hypothetical protein
MPSERFQEVWPAHGLYPCLEELCLISPYSPAKIRIPPLIFDEVLERIVTHTKIWYFTPTFFEKNEEGVSFIKSLHPVEAPLLVGERGAIFLMHASKTTDGWTRVIYGKDWKVEPLPVGYYFGDLPEW